MKRTQGEISCKKGMRGAQCSVRGDEERGARIGKEGHHIASQCNEGKAKQSRAKGKANANEEQNVSGIYSVSFK